MKIANLKKSLGKLTLLSLPVLLTACATNDADNFIKAEQLQHHHWVLTEIDGKAFASDDIKTRPDLEIGENMQSHGLAGCNTFRGQAEINPKTGEFRINTMAMTMKMCIGDSMNVERAVASTLSAWSKIDLSAKKLQLSNDEHRLTYTLQDWVN